MISLLIGVVLVAGALVTTYRHRGHLRTIPIRVHVNGTRGKSSVTRLIAAGLRAGGVRTLAKTTGTAARLIHTDGTERPFRRMWLNGPPSIGEQARLVRRASKEKVDALVVECMAVHPEIQRVAEEHFIQATVGVVTNVRQDHSDVMGNSPAAVAEVLALTVPRGGLLVLGPHAACAATFEAVAKERNTTVLHAKAHTLTPDELALFPETVFADNVVTALKVCEALHVPRATALRGMCSALPDPGALKVVRRTALGRTFWLVDAFAANDATSTLDIWQRVRNRPELQNLPAVGLFCNRGDRGFRLQELARDFAAQASSTRTRQRGTQETGQSVEPAAKQDVELAAKQAAELAAKQAAEPAAKQAAEPAAELAAKQAAELKARQGALLGVLVLGEGLLTARKAFRNAGLGFAYIPAVFTTPSVEAILQCACEKVHASGDVLLFGFGNTQGLGTVISHWFTGECS